jgi:hypothetical protein
MPRSLQYLNSHLLILNAPMLDSLDTLIAFVLIMLVVSLLITIAVQMVSSLLNLRGFNLAQGLKRAFAVIVPNSEQEARKLANFVLKGRFLSDSFLPDLWVFKPWRHATAIRPSEVFDALQRIAIGKEPVGNKSDLRETARKLLIALGVDEKTINDAAEAIHTTQKSTTDLTTDALKLLPEADQKKMQDALKDVTGRLDAAGQAIATKVVDAAEAMVTARKKFESWTCMAQERAQQWVTMHARILTSIFALVAAFWLQLDTVEIFKLVSSNKAVRDKLVAQAGAVEAQAARILVDGSVLKDALKAWREKQTDPAIANALAGIQVEDTDTREGVRSKVAKALTGKTPSDNFDAVVNATAKQRLKEQGDNFSAVKADFEKTGFDLFPRDGRFRWGNTWCNGFNEHFAGMLFSVGLLSLGAPFWYNALKNLTSLRSSLAQNISKEQEQGQKQPDGSKPKPPPTVK